MNSISKYGDVYCICSSFSNVLTAGAGDDFFSKNCFEDLGKLPDKQGEVLETDNFWKFSENYFCKSSLNSCCWLPDFHEELLSVSSFL